MILYAMIAIIIILLLLLLIYSIKTFYFKNPAEVKKMEEEINHVISDSE